ncbi:MAG: peptidylprolyl isomerase [Saprospiraceae bacterium]|nr:peptidylprolyl isomerase [Saprospiraceae bacterium]
MKYFFSLLICLFLLSCSNENHVSITTEYGTMKVQLFDSTPKHKENFKKLVKEGFYNDLLFHRVIKGFMIQGGDPESRGSGAGQTIG